MIGVGLTSVTFRKLSPDAVIEYAKGCGLDAIEWGSDIHAKPGDIDKLKRIRQKTEEAGIKISSYGSYYRLGGENFKTEFEKYAEAAAVLGAPIIRIWTGSKDFEDCTGEEYSALISELQYVCSAAERQGITVACEYHNSTLTNSRRNSLKVMEDAGRSNLGMYFQYNPKDSVPENSETLKAFIPYLKTVHVFNIDGDGNRYPIEKRHGISLWSDFAEILYRENADVNMLFEFLPEDSFECLKRETDVLRDICQNAKKTTERMGNCV